MATSSQVLFPTRSQNVDIQGAKLEAQIPLCVPHWTTGKMLHFEGWDDEIEHVGVSQRAADEAHDLRYAG